MPRRKNGKGMKVRPSTKFGPDFVDRVYTETVPFNVNTVTADGTTALDIYSELAGTVGFSEMSAVYRMVQMRKVVVTYEPLCQFPTTVGINSAFHVCYDPCSAVILPTTDWMKSNKNVKYADTNHRFTYSFRPVNTDGATGPVDLAATHPYGFFYAHLSNYSTPAPSNTVKVGHFALRYMVRFIHQTSPLQAQMKVPSSKVSYEEEKTPRTINQVKMLSEKVLNLEAMIKELKSKGYDFDVVEHQ